MNCANGAGAGSGVDRSLESDKIVDRQQDAGLAHGLLAKCEMIA
jgi:hypothetical protein